MKTDILLTTINATYQHAAFGLRYLMANLGDLRERAQLVEFTHERNAEDIAEALLSYNPRIIGFGVYIWNTEHTTRVVRLLKQLSPETIVVVGGPEVSFEWQDQDLCSTVDHVFLGESENSFRRFCQATLSTENPSFPHVIADELPDLNALELPYSLYTEEDIRNRFIYVEASRGCPFKCEFCLSSLDKSVRKFPSTKFLCELDNLIARGARQFKFVDRTFNLNIADSRAILEFFLARMDRGLFLHFELVPDRLPEELRALIRQFPPGTLQFEIGIQTRNPEIAARISRRQDYEKVETNLCFLREQTDVHIHADLIAGLPGETLTSFAEGFDWLARLNPHEIQVGILKRLRGTPIARHTDAFQMVYQSTPPYRILKSSALTFTDVQRLVRFARFWDLIANRGQFPEFMACLKDRTPSLFWKFWSLSEFLHGRHPKGYGIALLSLTESLWRYAQAFESHDLPRYQRALEQDYGRGGNRHVPGFFSSRSSVANPLARREKGATPSRQQRHLGIH